jgi:hypothetical protein
VALSIITPTNTVIMSASKKVSRYC